MRRVVRAVVGMAVLASALVLTAAPDDTAATPGPPNIVLVLTDDQTLESIAIAMPYLRGQPEGHWVTFERAFANTPLCCPSRASLLTGRYSHHTRVQRQSDGAKLDDTSTVATWLDDAGYRTGLVGKYLNGYPWGGEPLVPPGWDFWRARTGRVEYAGPLGPQRQAEPTVSSGYLTDDLNQEALEFLAEGSGDPFFLYLAHKAPHGPAKPAKRHRGDFSGLPVAHRPNFNERNVSDKPAWVRALSRLTPRDIEVVERRKRRAYETLLAVDEGIQQIFDRLAELGELDDTVIVLTTDQGLSWYAHRHGKKKCAYEECIATPLMVRYPAGPEEGRVVSKLVQNVDLAPTIAELAGVSPVTPVDGLSLVPLLEGASPPWRDSLLLRYRARVNDEVPSYWAVRTDRYKWVQYRSGERELYDFVADPYELRNRAYDPAYREEKRTLKDELRSLRR